MIELLVKIDLAAVRGGYYKLGHINKTKNPHMRRPLLPSYQSMKDGYAGRHPFNIITEEVLND